MQRTSGLESLFGHISQAVELTTKTLRLLKFTWNSPKNPYTGPGYNCCLEARAPKFLPRLSKGWLQRGSTLFSLGERLLVSQPLPCLGLARDIALEIVPTQFSDLSVRIAAVADVQCPNRLTDSFRENADPHQGTARANVVVATVCRRRLTAERQLWGESQ